MRSSVVRCHRYAILEAWVCVRSLRGLRRPLDEPTLRAAVDTVLEAMRKLTKVFGPHE